MDTQEVTKKFYKRWWFWVGAVFVLFIIIGVSGSGNTPTQSVAAPDESGTTATTQQPASATQVQAASKKSASVPAPTESTPAAAATQPASAPAAAPAAMQTLLDISGSGSKTTESFTAAGPWDLIWSYDCSSFAEKGNFAVFVYDNNGNMSFDNSGVNQLGASGSDTEYYHTGGTYYLEVNSECNWHMQVKG
jgi:hypothetical protein